MSAPRKIWIADDDMAEMRFEGMIWIDPQPAADLYHHDGPVQELKSIAGHALDQWESCIESEYAGTSSYDHMIADVHERRAALAKIAQEE